MINNKKGNSSILLLIIITTILCLMSLTVDAGRLYIEKGRLQNTLDSAALAAISVYREGEERMLEEAIKYAELNGLPAEELSIDIQEDNRKVTVSCNRNVALYFARFFDVDNADVEAESVAVAGAISAVGGIRPFAVEEQDFEYGDSYTLKEGGGGGSSGNYGALALGGNGACNYKKNIINGYNGPLLKVGDEVSTEPGNMAGPTYDGVRAILDSDPGEHGEDLSQLEANCPRIISIPIVETLDVCGRSKVKIVGFAAFFLENVKKKNGKTEIKGIFLEKITEGEIDEDAESFGLYGTKLVE